MNTRLPIEDVLESIRLSLKESHQVVLQAPPGAGKTTLVPISLVNENWLNNRKILLLEPRRIATRTAAHRMAELLGEPCGETVGYRMRLESKIAKSTRIEVITEGILTRMLQSDPSLEAVGLIIFDEFHERNLDSDLALALSLKGRSLFRDESNPLKLLIMSATLDVEPVADLLGGAAIIRSEGRSFPVETIYRGSVNKRSDICFSVFETIQQILLDNTQSSILIFLPGQGEIHRVYQLLNDWTQQRNFSHVHLKPLFGNLSLAEQQEAIKPLQNKLSGDQKIVIATNIAETSLTIEGVDIVVDSGLVREAFYNPATAMSGLRLRNISRASSVQRAGRAGRLKPGTCYRLWSESEQRQLEAHTPAEILNSDLTPVALQLLQWGISNPAELKWLDSPPSGAWKQAISLLNWLGATQTC